MTPLVGLVMGSDSDWPVMKVAAAALAEFDIPYRAEVLSAHRMATEMIEYGKRVNGEVRFIEYMDVGGATQWSPANVLSRREMLERLTARYGPAEPVIDSSSAPADRYRLSDGTVFGVISSTTEPFCRSCDRSNSRPG